MPEAQFHSGAPESVRLFDRTVALGTRERLTRLLLNSLENGPVNAYFCNVHMLMVSQENPELAGAMDSTRYVYPDGVPLAWLQHWLGFPDSGVLRGFEAVHAVCAQAASTGQPVGFLGSTDDVLRALRENLERKHHGLRVAYQQAPPDVAVNDPVDPALVAEINSRNLYCLFVGLGCPKQELWAADYRPHLNCSVLAVGAAFDWLAGTTRMPPLWMLDSGLGWLHRLSQDPIRMWPRYLIYNSRFLLRAARAVVSARLQRHGNHEEAR